MFQRIIYSFAILCLLTQCSNNNESNKMLPTAPAVSGVDAGKNKLISIQKASLDKQEFLLQSSFAIQSVVSWSTSLKSRVVVFKKVDNSVHMLESLEGNTASRSLPQTLLVAIFPITKETATEVQFDFNAGMQRLYLSEEWYAQDFSGDAYEPNTFSLALRNTYVDSVERNGNDLVIKQVSQAGVGIFGFENNLPLSVVYYLAPYKADPSFVPMQSYGKFDQYGFFEIQPQLVAGKGNSEVYYSRYNLKKPITYAISANTPKEYKEAVKKGVLYWNTVLGGEYLQVVEAPVGVTAPNPKYNIVQWLDYDDADMAYADAQADPRTGEILHAQIFLPSVFAFHTKVQVRGLLNRVREDEHSAKKNKSSVIREFMHKAHHTMMCDMDFRGKVSEGVSDLLKPNVAESAILRASQDLVTEVTAHEVGHTLGLRHNFAGSLGTKNYSLSDSRKIINGYLADGKVDNKIRPTASVMDYSRLEEGLLAGHLISKESVAFEYDEKAMKTLYFGANYSKKEMPVFCTDTDIMKKRYVDCNVFDGGSSIVEYAAESSRQAFENLHHNLLITFLLAKAPLLGSKTTPVTEVQIPVEDIAKWLLRSWSGKVAAIGSSKGLLAVRREYAGAATEDIKELVVPAELKMVSEEFNRLSNGKGDLELVYQIPSADKIADSQKRFEALLTPESLESYLSASGAKVTFSEEEIKAIKSKVSRFYALLPEALARGDQSLWRWIPNEWKDVKKSPEMAQTVLKLMQKRVGEYINATKKVNGKVQFIEATVKAKVEKKKAHEDVMDEEGFLAPAETIEVTVDVKLPVYTYPADIRRSAPPLLSSGSGDSETWGIQEKAAVKAAFKAEARKALGGKADLDKVKADTISVTPAANLQQVTNWIVDNQKVLNAF